jgi:hypothetical protein
MNTPYTLHQDTGTDLDRYCVKMGVKDFRMRVVIFANMHTEFMGPSSDDGAVGTLSVYIPYYMDMCRHPLYNHLRRCIQKYPLSFWKDPKNVTAFVDAYKDYIKQVEDLTLSATNTPLKG